METPAVPPDVPVWEREVSTSGRGPSYWIEPPPPLTWRSVRLNVLLFLATVVTVFLAGSLREFRDSTGAIAVGLSVPDGLRLVAGVLTILLCHEMGHYLACRYYGVAATLPFLIPAPPLLVGTFGALIRIKGPIPHRRALFDIGIAGPLAGFVACLPILVLGVVNAQVRPTPQGDVGPFFGEPLLLRWVTTWIKGPIADDMTLFVDPWGMAAWFGLFVTALNLIPVGQLDGGHVTYALFRNRAHVISWIAFGACLCLIYFGPNWLIWSALLWFLRRPHPPTLDDASPLGRGRAIVGAVGLIVFMLSFTPSPIVGSWHTFLQAFGYGGH
jgi:membrane-associated protease RseP (regulator of RpoE activity)